MNRTSFNGLHAIIVLIILGQIVYSYWNSQYFWPSIAAIFLGSIFALHWKYLADAQDWHGAIFSGIFLIIGGIAFYSTNTDPNMRVLFLIEALGIFFIQLNIINLSISDSRN